MNTFGIWAKARMKQIGMTQQELAEIINGDNGQVSKWINGVINPGLDKVNKIASALGCSVAFVPNETMDMMESTYNDGYKKGYRDALKKAAEKVWEMRMNE